MLDILKKERAILTSKSQALGREIAQYGDNNEDRQKCIEENMNKAAECRLKAENYKNVLKEKQRELVAAHYAPRVGF